VGILYNIDVTIGIVQLKMQLIAVMTINMFMSGSVQDDVFKRIEKKKRFYELHKSYFFNFTGGHTFDASTAGLVPTSSTHKSILKGIHLWWVGTAHHSRK
jgi:hypothetical protein